MIPAILHYVWVGSPLPAKQSKFIDSWRRTNPHFEIKCWDERNIDMSKPIIRDAYARKKWAKVADIARLQAVLSTGGIYLDTDFEVFKPLDRLLAHPCFYAFQEVEPTADWVCNGAFGAEPDHWFVKQALDGLYAMDHKWYRPERPTEYGPKHITRLLRQHGLDHYDDAGVTVKNIFVAPVPMFFPFHHTEEFTPECVTDITLAAHFWEKSWNSSIPLPMRVARDVRNRVRRQLAGAQRRVG